MDQKEVALWKEAGRACAKVLSYAKRIIKPDMPLLEIAEMVENLIEKNKIKNAFPINLSINEIAAHSSPIYNDKRVAHGLLKVDLGINVNGFISDSAISIDLTPEQKYSDIIKATETSLFEAIKVIKPNIFLSEIGEKIQEFITSHGFSPIINLCGHEMKRWKLHAGLTIPNYKNNDKTILQDGQILAIEPFATNGIGRVIDSKPSGIYKLSSDNKPRDSQARKLLDYITEEYHELPFSSRWLVKEFGTRALISLKILENCNAVHQFKQLVEKSGGIVAQFEHTILVTKNGCEVLTKSE